MTKKEREAHYISYINPNYPPFDNLSGQFIICSNCGYGVCSNCGHGRGVIGKPHYCPNCGADMRGDAE